MGSRYKHRRHGTVITVPAGVVPGTGFVKVGDHAEGETDTGGKADAGKPDKTRGKGK